MKILYAEDEPQLSMAVTEILKLKIMMWMLFMMATLRFII